MHATRPLIAGLALGLTLTACAPTDEGTPLALPSATPTDDVEPSPTPAPSPTDDATPTIDVTTVPDQFTPEYVEAVYDAVTSVFADLVNDVLATPADPQNRLDANVLERLSSISTDDARVAYLSGLDRLSQSEAARESYTGDRYRGPSLTDTTLLYAGPGCIVVAARLAFAGSGLDRPDDTYLTAVSFVPSNVEGPSAWLIADQLPNRSNGTDNPDSSMLDATLADFGDALDHSCEEVDDARP